MTDTAIAINLAPWVISGLAMASSWVTGNKDRRGWLLSAVNCLVTFIYNVITHQYGFFICNAYSVTISLRNYWLWGRPAVADEEDSPQ